MSRNRLPALAAALLTLLSLVVAAPGCGSSGTSGPTTELSHIRLLTNLYARTMSELGRRPKDEQEFKAMIQTFDPPLDRMRVDSIDELFVSERDGQPLVVLYGQQPAEFDIVAYEQTGVDGYRQVSHKIGKVDFADEATFRELVPAAAK